MYLVVVSDVAKHAAGAVKAGQRRPAVSRTPRWRALQRQVLGVCWVGALPVLLGHPLRLSLHWGLWKFMTCQKAGDGSRGRLWQFLT